MRARVSIFIYPRIAHRREDSCCARWFCGFPLVPMEAEGEVSNGPGSPRTSTPIRTAIRLSSCWSGSVTRMHLLLQTRFALRRVTPEHPSTFKSTRFSPMNCLYTRLDDGRWRCQACGDETSRARHAAPIRHCAAAAGDAPPQLIRVANFSIAAISHLVSGLPTCTQIEIDQRHATCKSCELFSRDTANAEVGICRHRSCGCTITNEARFLSKLAWRDQKCPLGKWPAT